MISIFTPVYNRGHTIHRVYQSLIAQTSRDFEWIIVDDGSVDNIAAVIEGYIAKSEFEIKFHQLDINRGKHVAINHGVLLAEGELFLIADSDDAFKSDTVAFILGEWQSLTTDEQQSISGLRVCVEDQFGVRVSDTLPTSPMIMSMQDAFYKYRFQRESWSADRTDLLRLFPFPTDHKGYYPEGIIWKAVSRVHPIKFFNDVLRIYYREDGSIMNNTARAVDKISRRLVVTKDVLINDIHYFRFQPRYFLHMATVHGYYHMHNSSFRGSTSGLSATGILLVLVTAPLAFTMYTFRKVRDRLAS